MRAVVATAALVLCASGRAASAQCGDLDHASASAAAEYVKHADISHASASCVRAAYEVIKALDIEKRVPILLSLFPYRIPSPPKVPNVTVGPVMPQDFYPAVDALLDINDGAEPAVLDYIATDPDKSPTGWENAVYTLWVLQFHRSIRAPGTVRSLKAKRAQLTNVAEINRMTDAIRLFIDKYCKGSGEGPACVAEANSP